MNPLFLNKVSLLSKTIELVTIYQHATSEKDSKENIAIVKHNLYKFSRTYLDKIINILHNKVSERDAEKNMKELCLIIESIPLPSENTLKALYSEIKFNLNEIHDSIESTLSEYYSSPRNESLVNTILAIKYDLTY